MESVIKESMGRPAAIGRQADEGGIPFITEEMLVGIKRDFEAGMARFPKTSLLFILLNAAVFVWQVATGALDSRETLIAAGALSQEHVASGEVWRLLSCTMLHGSFQHLLSNSLVLYILGMACEHIFGSGATVLIYVASGLCGSLLSVSLQSGPSVGASGAVFGVMAAVIFFFYRHQKTFYLRDNRIGIVLGVYAFYQFMVGAFQPYIDNLAHLGGFIGGVSTALLLKPVLSARKALQPLSPVSPAAPAEKPGTFALRPMFGAALAIVAAVLIVLVLVSGRKAEIEQPREVIAAQPEQAEQIEPAAVNGLTLRDPDGKFETNGDIIIYGTVVNESREVKSWQVAATILDQAGTARATVRMVNGVQQLSPEEYQVLVTKRNVQEADLRKEEVMLTPGSTHAFTMRLVDPPSGLTCFTIDVK